MSGATSAQRATPIVRAATSAAELAVARGLLRAYGDALGAAGAAPVHADADALPGPYAAPRGRLLVAWLDGAPAGCVALKPLADADAAEAKRMYVAPWARGRGVARALMTRLIDDARAAGYARVRLGTLPTMLAARTLYERLGFAPVPPYRGDEVGDGTLFFERALD